MDFWMLSSLAETSLKFYFLKFALEKVMGALFMVSVILNTSAVYGIFVNLYHFASIIRISTSKKK